MDICYFIEHSSDVSKQAILVNVAESGRGQVQWRPLVDSFEAERVELVLGGNPPLDGNGFTPHMFQRDQSYGVHVFRPLQASQEEDEELPLSHSGSATRQTWAQFTQEMNTSLSSLDPSNAQGKKWREWISAERLALAEKLLQGGNYLKMYGPEQDRDCSRRFGQLEVDLIVAVAVMDQHDRNTLMELEQFTGLCKNHSLRKQLKIVCDKPTIGDGKHVVSYKEPDLAIHFSQFGQELATRKYCTIICFSEFVEAKEFRGTAHGIKESRQFNEKVTQGLNHMSRWSKESFQKSLPPGFRAQMPWQISDGIYSAGFLCSLKPVEFLHSKLHVQQLAPPQCQSMMGSNLLTEEKLLQAWLAYSQLSRFDLKGNADTGDFTSLGQEAFDFVSDFGGDFQRIKVDVMKKGEGLSVYRGFWQGNESIFKSSSNMKNNLDPKITQVSREKYALKALEGSGAPYLPHYLSSGTFVSESGSRFSVVIESLAGLPLLRFLNWPQKGISLDAWAGMRLLASLLSAGLTMIDHGVEHGDIRPQNLLTDGNYFAICDFGYSQIHAKYAAQFEREYPEQINYPWPLIQDPLFSSLETLRGDESLPVLSDMEAGVYTLAFLLERGLPWRVTDDFVTLMEKRVQARDTGSNWPALKRLPTIGRDVCGWILKNGSKKTVSRQEYLSQIATLNQAIFQKEGIRMPLILPNVIKGVQNSPESDISMQSGFIRD